MKKPIFLTGFMGTGKTRIGSLLARRLKRVFIDTDQLIEAQSGKTIPEIFAEDGEAHFRGLEHDCVVQAATVPDAVVALGGGAIIQDKNWQTIRRAGVLICLEADVETILERVGRKEDRPLLVGLDAAGKKEKIHRMLEERAPYYQRAHIQLHTNNDEAAEVAVDRLIELLEYWDADRTSRT